jgi:hypothetical protein
VAHNGREKLDLECSGDLHFDLSEKTKSMMHLGVPRLHLDEEALGKRPPGVLYSRLEEEVLGTRFPGFLC